MPTMYCPRCRGTKEMRVTVERRTEKGADGKTRQVETEVCHCRSCNGFVRSRERLAEKAA